MQITITLHCHNCQSAKVKKNGKKSCGKQNYQCKFCNRQFIGDHAIEYQGCHSSIIHRVLSMLVRGIGIRDVSAIEKISVKKVLSVLVKSVYVLQPKRTHYETIEVDEFWTYVKKKSNKLWLLYAYERESGEIIAYVWGKRNLKTARKLRQRLSELGVNYTKICSYNWKSFVTAFKSDNHEIGKEKTVGIEGNNCRLRHRIRRAFRKTCCFSKKIINHLKAFDLAFFYINWGYI
jgi:IS1 family transposase/transposase-like protein